MGGASCPDLNPLSMYLSYTIIISHDEAQMQRKTCELTFVLTLALPLATIECANPAQQLPKPASIVFRRIWQ